MESISLCKFRPRTLSKYELGRLALNNARDGVSGAVVFVVGSRGSGKTTTILHLVRKLHGVGFGRTIACAGGYQQYIDAFGKCATSYADSDAEAVLAARREILREGGVPAPLCLIVDQAIHPGGGSIPPQLHYALMNAHTLNVWIFLAATYLLDIPRCVRRCANVVVAFPLSVSQVNELRMATGCLLSQEALMGAFHVLKRYDALVIENDGRTITWLHAKPDTSSSTGTGTGTGTDAAATATATATATHTAEDLALL